MDDTLHGTRNKRGDWAPDGRREVAPLWAWPPRLLKVLAWLPGYIWPWNAFHMATALLWWFFVVPDAGTLKTLGWGWPALPSRPAPVPHWAACGRSATRPPRASAWATFASRRCAAARAARVPRWSA